MKLLYWIVFSLTGFSCALGLRQPPGPPRGNPVGLYISEAEAPLFHILRIEKVSDSYVFDHLSLNFRDLALSGRILETVRREGKLLTSADEILLVQEKYSHIRRKNQDRSDSPVWALDQFQEEMLERKIEGDSYAYLHLSRQGADSSLVGGGRTYRRLGPDSEAQAYLSSLCGVILQAGSDGKLMVAAFDPGIVKSAGPLDLWSIQGQERKIRIEKCDGYLCQASGPPGQALLFDAVLPADWRKRQDTSAPLSREEIMRRLQRGEEVPKDQLMRVLQNQGR